MESRQEMVARAKGVCVNGPLHGIRVLDLSRILAGPTCTQLLGDLGADVIKVERPGHGDDTRAWGPPFVRDPEGNDTTESAYYLCANRNKRSIAVDFTSSEGADLIRRLAAESDVLIENYRVGTLAKHGLDFTSLQKPCPQLVYCSISGFGQTGPRRDEPGYDFLVQAMGGIMSLTGEEEGAPVKVGVGIADVMCGMYASVGILSALRHRDATGQGQHIDLALFDAQIAWLINGATNFLTSGELPKRFGNAHPNIVPYQVFTTLDGHVILAIGNDAQFGRFCEVAARSWAKDERFATNAARLRHREVLVGEIAEVMGTRTMDDWISALKAVKVPIGPVNTLDRVFDDPQTIHRKMRIRLDHSTGASVDLLGNPLRFSATPVTYRRPPPMRAEHTDETLRELLGATPQALESWRQAGVIE